MSSLHYSAVWDIKVHYSAAEKHYSTLHLSKVLSVCLPPGLPSNQLQCQTALSNTTEWTLQTVYIVHVAACCEEGGNGTFLLTCFPMAGQ